MRTVLHLIACWMVFEGFGILRSVNGRPVPTVY